MEHGLEYAAKTRQQLRDFGLETYARVIHAPLQAFRIGDRAYLWYRLDSLPDNEIDMLVVDGPPGFLQKHSRYPAVPLLGNRFSAHCTLFLDDAARDDEQEIVHQWQAEHPDLTLEYRATERGCSILTRGGR
jgi:hypothetical protein